VRLCALDIGLMQAGAAMKGEFEQRLRSVIDEVQASPQPVILFIDEAHTLIGAGGAAGTGDAANLLKPALARGTLRTIAATTWAEYRQHIEKDPALTRRFQPIHIDEPDVARCCDMVRGCSKNMEAHHKVRISDAAVVAAVQLSHRYIPARQLPDKAVSLLDTACARVATSRAGLGAPEKPVGVFMLCGPSGVGKTETALALAETLYGGEQNLISINMSEFQEAHTVSTLKGAPPGYVGYGKGGILTEAVRRRPYSVILLDEVEKAHPDVHEIFFQVFDKGMMDDSEGRRIDFKNTLILLTSNVGSAEIMAQTEGGRTRADLEELDRSLRGPLLKVFPPALLGRLVTIPYYPLSDSMIEAITRHQFRKIAGRLRTSHGAELEIGEGVMDLVKARCTEVESGGRMIDAILTNTLLPELSRGVLNRALEGGKLTRVTVGSDERGFTYAFD
jgi:ATP-dependent Clp protease ATP-binding subunit ClpA